VVKSKKLKVEKKPVKSRSSTQKKKGIRALLVKLSYGFTNSSACQDIAAKQQAFASQCDRRL
jgi:hypothetical protein